MKKSNVLVYGIGIKGMKYPAVINDNILDEYRAWRSFLFRCTETCWGRQEAYKGTSCSENFKYYEFFYEWYHKQVGHLERDETGRKYHLDKDLLVKGNKLYSEDTCVFVPQRINSLLVSCKANRGDLPIGVCWHKANEKYTAQGWDGKHRKTIGYYSSVEDAFLAYKTFKEAYIKQIAEQYKSQIDERAYQALMNYQVEITD